MYININSGSSWVLSCFSDTLILQQTRTTVQVVYVQVEEPLTDLGLCHHCGLSVAEWRERQAELCFFVPLEIQKLPQSKSFSVWLLQKCTPPSRHTHTHTQLTDTHNTRTHHNTVHHKLTLLSTGFGFVWPPP